MPSSLLSRALRRAAPLVALVVATACASNPNAVSPGNSGRSGDRYIITADELTRAGANNLYEAIQKLRPDYLRVRGNNLGALPSQAGSKGNGPPTEVSSSSGTAMSNPQQPVRVYQNDQMLTGTDDLRHIPLSQVLEVRYIPGPQAGIRYGTNHTGGVILVSTRQ